MSNFPKQLKLLRKERKLTQQELAKVIDFDQSTISYYESGSKEPDIDNLIRFANFFDVTLDKLVGREYK